MTDVERDVPGQSTAYIGLGSNVGDRAQALRDALQRIQEWAVVERVSSVYETEPVGYQEQPRFLNMVARCRARLEPVQWVDGCLSVERALGRVRSFRNAPRRIDLDVLLVDDQVVDEPGVEVPHPRLSGRAFVLVPLLEIEPDLRDPRSGRALGEWLDRLPDQDRLTMEKLMNGEDLLNSD